MKMENTNLIVARGNRLNEDKINLLVKRHFEWVAVGMPPNDSLFDDLDKLASELSDEELNKAIYLIDDRNRISGNDRAFVIFSGE